MVLIYPYCYFYFLPYISSAAIFSFNRQFHPDNHSCAEQVIPTNHQVAFHLPIYLPTLTQRVTMLISGVYVAHHIVPVRAERTAYAQVAMVVASSCHARLVGYAQAPRVVVAPKRLRAYVTARSAFVPFQIHVPEILPSVMITCLMFVSHRQVHASLIQESGANLQPPPMVVRKSRNTSGKQDYRQYKHLVQIKILHA